MQLKRKSGKELNNTGIRTSLCRFLISIIIIIPVFTIAACNDPDTTIPSESADISTSEQVEKTVQEQTDPPVSVETDPSKSEQTESPAPEETDPPVSESIPENPLLKYEGDHVFGFIDGSDPSMPVWDSESQGYIPQEGDLREQLIIDENFIIPVGEEVIFQNQIVRVRPGSRQDIEVFGTLIINNSLVLWDQTEHQQTRLRIKDGGKLIVNNSYVFQSNQFWLNWEFEDGSTIRLDNFVGQPWCCIHGSVDYTAVNYSTIKITFLNDVHDTVVEISDAHHLWFELFPPTGNHEITFPEKRQWVDWRLSNMWSETTVNVTHSYLYERDISISNDTHITVKDTPSGFSIGWAISHHGTGFVDCELRALGDPNNDHGVFYDDMVWDLPCNNSSLTVKNSLFQRAWPVTWGQVHLKIYNSNLVDPRNYGGPATLEIYDSTIDHIAAYQGGKVYVENSRIRYDIEVKDPDSTIHGYRISKRDGSGDIEIIEVDGGVYIKLESPGPSW